MSEDIKKSMLEEYEKAMNKMRSIDFQVDTLSEKTSTGGYFTPSDNTITINYVEGDKAFNEWSGSKALLIHEQKHRDNQKEGLKAYAISDEQAYKIGMHNEISANMASLIYLRNQYLKTGDMKVFDEEEGRFSFYADAIKSGEINPFSQSDEDFDKDMALIANGTRDMWVREFASKYAESHLNNAEYFGEKDGKHAKFYDQNYENAKKVAYTIGGVDFTQYMDKDVEIPYESKLEFYKKYNKLEELGVPKYDGSMSLLQYQKLLQHALVMQNGDVGINSEAQFCTGSDMTKGKFNLDMGAYTYLVDNKLIDSTKEKYKEALDTIAKDDKKFIDNIIVGIAKDYEKRGEKLPEDNDEAYNAAVNKLYSGEVKFDQEDLKYEGNINLREAYNPNDELPLNELPAKAKECQQKMENMGSWERGLLQYANFFGEDIKFDKFDKLPGAVKYPLEALGGYVGIPIVAGGKKCIELGEDCVDAVKSWFVEEEVKNDPVRPVSKDNKPQYDEWSAERRVSPVQNVELLDLTANVIERPSDRRLASAAGYDREALKRDMQNEAKEKARMFMVVEGMNRINGAKNAMDVSQTVNTLYDKFGNNAYELLAKAVNEPFSFARNVRDSSIKTSRDAVRSLCDTDDVKKNAVINAVLTGAER